MVNKSKSSIGPFMQQHFNSTYAYLCNFDFDGDVMEGILPCLWRMVPDADACKTINCKMKMYWEASGLSGFVDANNERSIFNAT